jgi:hypothetical protein
LEAATGYETANAAPLKNSYHENDVGLKAESEREKTLGESENPEKRETASVGDAKEREEQEVVYPHGLRLVLICMTLFFACLPAALDRTIMATAM